MISKIAEATINNIFIRTKCRDQNQTDSTNRTAATTS